jgi:hypothetical protein
MAGGREFYRTPLIVQGGSHEAQDFTTKDPFLDQGFIMKTIGYKCYVTGQSKGEPEVPPNTESCSFLGS